MSSSAAARLLCPDVSVSQGVHSIKLRHTQLNLSVIAERRSRHLRHGKRPKWQRSMLFPVVLKQHRRKSSRSDSTALPPGASVSSIETCCDARKRPGDAAGRALCRGRSVRLRFSMYARQVVHGTNCYCNTRSTKHHIESSLASVSTCTYAYRLVRNGQRL